MTRDKIIEVMAAAICGPNTPCEACRNSAARALSIFEAKGLAVVQRWQPIESAPKDRLILVYCPSYQGLNAIVCCCQWHEDAGFCVDELRSPSHWMPLPAPPTNSTKEESDK